MLPVAKHFNYQDASERLGISRSELAYHYTEGNLRVAVATARYTIQTLFPVGRLSDRNQLLLRNFRDQYDLINSWELVYPTRETQPIPDYLYLDPDVRNIRYTDEAPHAYKLMVFSTCGGEVVVPIDETGAIEFIYLGALDEFGMFSEGVITQEELERLTRPEVAACSPKDQEVLTELFLFKQDAAGAAIIELGNQFLREHKKRPTALELLKFMESKAHKPGDNTLAFEVVREPSGRRGWWRIEGIEMTHESFKKRLKNAIDGGVKRASQGG